MRMLLFDLAELRGDAKRYAGLHPASRLASHVGLASKHLVYAALALVFSGFMWWVLVVGLIENGLDEIGGIIVVVLVAAGGTGIGVAALSDVRENLRLAKLDVLDLQKLEDEEDVRG